MNITTPSAPIHKASRPLYRNTHGLDTLLATYRLPEDYTIHRDNNAYMLKGGEDEPSIECPVSDFFGIGHDMTTSNLSTMLFFVAPMYGYNSPR